MKDPMLDENFLQALTQYHHKFIWAKIIALDFEEYPTEEITGKITSGNINVDGSSAVRRTCNLTIAADDVNINNFYWSLNTKFKVYIGLENWIDDSYPDIIWFKQGMFLISTFNCALNANSYTINIQGKDKMVLLNGDVGGVVPYSWDFGKIDTTMEDGVIEQDFFLIKDIILEAVHEFAQDGWENIIVNDLDDYGVELLEYTGESPLYYIISSKGDNDSREVVNATVDGSFPCWIRKDSWENGKRKIGTTYLETEISKLENFQFSEGSSEAGAFCYEKLMEQLDPSGNVTETKNYFRAYITLKNPAEIESPDVYTVAKITKDNGLQVCGYRLCGIIYPYDLILSPGETITSMLDKLVKMLGNFEYFYDVDGRFIFQKKKTYTDVSYNNIINEHSISSEVWADNSNFNSKFSYTFNRNTLLSSIQSTPNLANLKNDFSLWGARSSGNIVIPIHMRYAIDHKPFYYKTIGYHIARNDNGSAIDKDGKEIPLDNTGKKLAEGYDYFYDNAGKVYITEEGVIKWQELRSQYNATHPGANLNIDIFETEQNIVVVDWREIIYQMANDYRRHYKDQDFLLNIRDNNKYTPLDSFYQDGYTSYEKYYIDFEMNLSQGVLAYWRELYNPEAIEMKTKITAIYNKYGDCFIIPSWINDLYSIGDYVIYDNKFYESLTDDNYYEPTDTNNWEQIENPGFTYNSDGWNPDILNDPESLNFWFDFLDTTGELNKYSVQNIGQRTKATNDDKIKAIYYRETPNVIFKTSDEDDVIRIANWQKPGYAYINIPDGMRNLFNISSRGKNAMDVVEEYLYSYTYPVTTISLSSIPIFYLSPNTLIYIDDDDTGIHGEYIMQKFSFQLGLTTQMTINAVETAKRIY